jgi:hypothetical protein
MNNRARQLLLHLVGCIVFLALPILFKPGPNDPRNMFIDFRFMSDLIVYLLLIGFFYLNYYLLVPEYYFKRKYLLYVLLVIGFYFVLISIPDLFMHGPPPPQGMNGGEMRPPPRGEHFLLHKIGNNLFLFMIVLFFSLMLRISSQWKKTEEEKITAELSYLKAQINPHFLFNTLNSIYSLAIQKSDDTAAAVVKLSGMMRYVISEAHKDFVSLEKEITYLRSYIELQQIRFGNSIQLTFSIEGTTEGKVIAPLVLIPFIENAFKHGVNAEEDSDIRINVLITEQNLILTVRNKKVFVRHSADDKSGLGIDNTRMRLQLLYPSRHQLVITDTDESFSVYLELTLK